MDPGWTSGGSTSSNSVQLIDDARVLVLSRANINGPQYRPIAPKALNFGAVVPWSRYIYSTAHPRHLGWPRVTWQSTADLAPSLQGPTQVWSGYKGGRARVPLQLFPDSLHWCFFITDIPTVSPLPTPVPPVCRLLLSTTRASLQESGIHF